MLSTLPPVAPLPGPHPIYFPPLMHHKFACILQLQSSSSGTPGSFLACQTLSACVHSSTHLFCRAPAVYEPHGSAGHLRAPWMQQASRSCACPPHCLAGAPWHVCPMRGSAVWHAGAWWAFGGHGLQQAWMHVPAGGSPSPTEWQPWHGCRLEGLTLSSSHSPGDMGKEVGQTPMV